MEPIDSFSGRYKFLSNFYEGTHFIYYDGHPYRTVEHAYQAAKCNNDQQRALFRVPGLKPGQAKRMGRNFKHLRYNWDALKVHIMLDLLRDKFKDPVLRKLLIETGDRDLIEGNTWFDYFWGVCGGVGENALGKLLMVVRSEVNGGPPVEFSIEVRHSDNQRNLF